MQRFYFLVISILASLCLSETYAVSFNLDSIAAKGKFAKFCVNTYHWVDKTFNGSDTAYVQSTGFKWNVKFRTSSWCDFNDFYFNRDHQIRMQSPFCSSIGGDIQFMAVALGYDINVNRLFGGKDRSKSKFNFEFSSGLVTARLYSINNNDGMNVSNVTGIGNLKFDYEGINSLIWGIDAIFVFNPRRYSNSAILSFGKIQKKSQGSWLTGITYQFQKLNFDFNKFPQEIKDWLPGQWNIDRFHTSGYNIGISAGYGYNWVPRKNFALGFQVMLIPCLNYGYTNNNNKSYSFRLNQRLNVGAAWNLGRWFIGTAARFDTSQIYSQSTLTTGLINIEAKVGWRFNFF